MLAARNAAAMPDMISLEDGTRRLTWRELQSWVDGVALELRTYGLVGWDRVSIWMSNRVEAVITFLCLFAGRLRMQSLPASHLHDRRYRGVAGAAVDQGR